MNFIQFRDALGDQFKLMQQHKLYKVDVSKDDMWSTYLNSFPMGTNPIFRERTVHDCQCCKQFIRVVGNVVCFIDGKKVTIWDAFDIYEMDVAFRMVSYSMCQMIKQAPVCEPFFHYEGWAGTDHNHAQHDGVVETWNHFHVELPAQVVRKKELIPTIIDDNRTTLKMFERVLAEIPTTVVDTVLELISQNSLYKGDEYQNTLNKFRALCVEYKAITDPVAMECFLWETSTTAHKSVTHIRNSVIGKLLLGLAEGKTLDAAVGAFEAMVAPSNYKRPKALITQTMINLAQDKVKELGFLESLERRHAVPTDLTINNVLFADRDAKASFGGGVFDELSSQVAINTNKLSKVAEIDINTFIDNILPKVDKVELLMENHHESNLMSLIAPVHHKSNNMLKWDNNFSWTYHGEIADSMKQRVKAAGGDVTGVMRYSIQWNDGDNNQNDFDAHCIEPDGNLIYYGNRSRMHPSTAMLDVDIIHPGNKVAVENITWATKSRMQLGVYTFIVHNFSHNGGVTGFTAEFEYNSEIRSYRYDRELRNGEKVTVLKGSFNGDEFTVHDELPSSIATKEMWGITTMQYQRVSMVMNSPNHWDGEQTGNKHTFFILADCRQPGTARGFYNEFLTDQLRDHRKVFEVLGSKMRVKESDTQLSGLGFSSTQRNHVYCRVSGSFTRDLKITF